jgi:hypothetical protein
MDVILGTGEKKEMFLRYDGDGKDEKRDSVVIEQREVADITV